MPYRKSSRYIKPEALKRMQDDRSAALPPDQQVDASDADAPARLELLRLRSQRRDQQPEGGAPDDFDRPPETPEQP